jgi:putative chitinase
MSPPLSLTQLLQLAPSARESYRDAFSRHDVLAASGLLTHPRRLAHFLAQVCHETGGLTILVENLNYRAERIVQMGNASPPGSRWRSLVPRAAELAGKPQAFANAVYGGRMGNRDPDDGWRFIGRGLLQITGRAKYARVGRALGLALEVHPYLAASAEHALAVAVEVWRSAGCMAHADADDVVKVTRAINGGTFGIADRRAWLAKAKALLGMEAPA